LSAGSKKGLWTAVQPWLIWFHRWSGIFVCLLFAMWFASGAVLIFVPFPSLSAGELHERAEALDLGRLRVSPSQVVRSVPGASRLKLASVLGEPVYLAGFPQPMHMNARRTVVAIAPRAISGETGRHFGPITAAQAAKVAAGFGRTAAIKVTGPLRYDQWIISDSFDRYRPFFKVALDDAQATEVYVSAVTGQPVQVTTRSQRFWAWTGAVLHWIYFPPVRRSFAFWDGLVWWVSLFALLSASAGVWLGIYRTMQSVSKKGRISFFRSWLKWHHTIGVFAFLFVLTWTFSGWLSMDHGYWFSQGAASESEIAAFRGAPLSSIASGLSLSDLKALAPASEIDFEAVNGHPFLLAFGSGGRPRIQWTRLHRTDVRLPESELAQAVATAWPGTLITYRGPVSRSSIYYDSEDLYPNTVRFDLGASHKTNVYVDYVSGSIVAVVDGSRRAYAWLFYGLHTLKVPGLILHPLLREALELLLLGSGFALSITGIYLGYRRLSRDLMDYLQRQRVGIAR
jgi:uncharacterized iron-regulated membrane protein